MIRSIYIFIAFLFSTPSFSRPLHDGFEYKCRQISLHRITGAEKVEIPQQGAKHFYITLKDNTLFSYYKNPMEETGLNNAQLIKEGIFNERGRQFDALYFSRVSHVSYVARDMHETIRIFKELNGRNPETIAMQNVSRIDGYSFSMQWVYSCDRA